MVKNASDIRFLTPKPENYDGKRLDQIVNDDMGQYPAFDNAAIEKQIKRIKVLEQIEDYCSSVGILPEDLILAHKQAQGGIKKKKLGKVQGELQNAANEAVIDKKDHSKWNENYKNRKLFGE